MCYELSWVKALGPRNTAQLMPCHCTRRYPSLISQTLTETPTFVPGMLVSQPADALQPPAGVIGGTRGDESRGHSAHLLAPQQPDLEEILVIGIRCGSH